MLLEVHHGFFNYYSGHSENTFHAESNKTELRVMNPAMPKLYQLEVTVMLSVNGLLVMIIFCTQPQVRVMTWPSKSQRHSLNTGWVETCQYSFHLILLPSWSSTLLSSSNILVLLWASSLWMCWLWSRHDNVIILTTSNMTGAIDLAFVDR